MSKTYDERYAEIQSISLTLFIQNGLKDTTVNEIVKAVDIAKGTFYHYFDSKETLILALRSNYIRNFITFTTDHMSQCESSDWQGKVHAWCIASITFYFSNQDEHNALFQQQHYFVDNEDRRSITQFLERFIIEGNDVKAWNVESPDLVALMIYHSMHMIIDESRDDSFIALKETAERFYKIFIKILA